MIKRELTLPSNRSFFLFGPRQTGKTTVIRAFLTGKTFLEINLLDVKKLNEYTARPDLLAEEIKAVASKVEYIFIDEVQRLPIILNEIQLLIDKKVPSKFILTGSSARKLKRIDTNLLGGRARSLELFSLSAFELKERFSLNEVLNFGSLPAIATETDETNKILDLDSYVNIYLEQEIKAEALTRNLGGFIRFLKVAAQTNGELINYSNIAGDTNINYMTVKDYFSILEDTLIGKFLFPVSKSERKRHKTSPKFYFFDTGVLRAIQGKVTLKLQPGTFEYGNLFETLVINEVFRINSYMHKRWSLSFLRTANDVEVDLIIETPGGKTLGIEIKSKPTPDLRDFRAGYHALKSLVPAAEFCCVSGGTHTRLVEEEIKVYAVPEFFEMLRELN